MGGLMQELLSKLVGCEKAGHAFPKPYKDESGMVYFRRKLETQCAVCGLQYRVFLEEVA